MEPSSGSADPATTSASYAIPSITDLGRRLADLDRRLDHHMTIIEGRPLGGEGPTRVASRWACHVLEEQIGALRNLILAMEPASLGDTAHLVACAATAAGILETADTPAIDAATIERVLLGILPILADAAGLDMDAMGWEPLIRLRALRFAGLEMPQ